MKKSPKKKLEKLPLPRGSWSDVEVVTHEKATLIAVKIEPDSEAGPAVYVNALNCINLNVDPMVPSEKYSDPVATEGYVVETASDDSRARIAEENPQVVADAIRVIRIIDSALFKGTLKDLDPDGRKKKKRDSNYQPQLSVDQLIPILESKGISWPFSKTVSDDSDHKRISQVRIEWIQREAAKLYGEGMTELPRGAKKKLLGMALAKPKLFTVSTFHSAYKLSNLRVNISKRPEPQAGD